MFGAALKVEDLNYAKASQTLHSCDPDVSTKIGNNTLMRQHVSLYQEEDEPSGIEVVLHKTRILLFKKNGEIVLNSGGWKTSITKDRMNKLLPKTISVIQVSRIWYVRVNNQPLIPFFDGMVVKPA